MKRSIPRSLVSKATNLDTNKERASGSEGRTESVSYTHLTLPTILRV